MTAGLFDVEATATRRDLVVRVVGAEPVPQGSMIGLARGRHVQVVPSNETKLRPWRKAVAAAADSAIRAAGWELIDDEPVTVVADFYLARPASTPPRLRLWPHKRPDLDKLVRAAFDSLTGRAYDDDARVVRLLATKHYAADRPVGVTIRVVQGVLAIQAGGPS